MDIVWSFKDCKLLINSVIWEAHTPEQCTLMMGFCKNWESKRGIWQTSRLYLEAEYYQTRHSVGWKDKIVDAEVPKEGRAGTRTYSFKACTA